MYHGQASFFNLPLLPSSKRLFSFSSLSALRVVPSAYLRLLIVLPAILILRSHPAQHFTWCTLQVHDFPGGSDGKAFAYNAEDLGSIPGSGRSPGVGNGNPLQYSCLENPWMEEPGRLQSMGPQRVEHDWATSLFTLHVSYISQVTIFILDVLLSFLNFAPVHCSMSSSNCCFLSCIEVSQDAGKVVWYFHLFKNLPVCSNPHKGFSVVNEAEVDHFFKIPLLYLWSKGCRQFDLWFLCLF